MLEQSAKIDKLIGTLIIQTLGLEYALLAMLQSEVCSIFT